ncbi:MAG: hypothetical protein U0L05_01335 [Schaedlerella sp.]|nr:hypothetical protein [Schaedlerella sp.]
MVKNILAEYAFMKEEIKDLRRRIEADKKEIARLERMVVSDSVTRGKKGKKPLGTVKIQGRPVSLIRRRQQACSDRMRRLEKLELSLLEKQSQVEEYIQQIEKSELRIMFRFYFVDDLSYAKVALRMNEVFPKRRIKYTDENVRKRIQRYLENVPQCPDEIC